MNPSFPIFGLLKKPKYLGLFFAALGIIFYFNYYLMANLPGEENRMCVMGAGLTVVNMIFAFCMSVMVGLLVIGFWENNSNRSRLSKLKVGSSSIFGLGLGTLTTFCSFCSFPALTFFGSGLGLSFFSDYGPYIKVLSLVLLVVGLYFVNKELKEGCSRCIV